MKSRMPFRIKLSFIILVWLAIVQVLSIREVWPKSDLEVIFLEVGQGDSALIQAGSEQLLIDTGDGEKVLKRLSETMPFWDRKIETIIVTHPDSDHSGGLTKILNHYEVGVIYKTWFDASTQNYQKFLKLAAEKNIPVTVPVVGQKVGPVLDGSFQFLWPEPQSAEEKPKNSNDTSLVGRFCYREDCILFLGDLEKEGQESMISSYDERNDNLGDIFRSQIVKASHHGATNGYHQTLYDLVQPKWAVLSAGQNNKYGHPAPSVVRALEEAHYQVWRTDTHGTAKFHWQGDFVLVK